MSFDAHGIKPYGQTPTALQLEHLKLGKKAFFHFGVNTFSDAEWGNGKEAEQSFRPVGCDVRSWIAGIQQAGFRLAILTAKHHDGFCLWQTEYSEHSMKNCPYKGGKGDIVKEFTDACREYGIRAGIYISPWDRNSPLWGKDEYSDYYKNQLTELMTSYGRIDEVWWDGAGSQETVYRWNEWAEVIHRLQPHAGIFGSMGATPYVSFRWVGNERGFAGETHYASIDAKYLAVETPEMLNVGVQGGDRYLPAEVDVSIRPGWFYHKAQDGQVKSPETLDRIWFDSIGRGAMLLLNFPPDRTGHIYPTDLANAVESNRRIEEMLAKNYAEGAAVTASSAYTDECKAENLLTGDDRFFAFSENDKNPRIDIYPKADSEYNVLILQEEVRLGERISGYRVEEIDGSGNSILLAVGTSVGYTRAVRIPLKNYAHLRIVFTGYKAFPCLSSLSLHRYAYALKDCAGNTPENVMKLPTASAEFSSDRKTVRLAFGGIYSVNILRILPRVGKKITVETFDGTLFRKAVETEVGGAFTSVAFADTACYQIRVTCDEPIPENASFTVTRT